MISRYRARFVLSASRHGLRFPGSTAILAAIVVCGASLSPGFAQSISEPAASPDRYPPQTDASAAPAPQGSDAPAPQGQERRGTVRSVPALEASPAVFNGNATVTLTIPPNWPLSTNRYRIAVYEAGRPTRLAEIQREFNLVNGRLQTTFAMQAPVGRYEIRLVSGDKARTPIDAAGPAFLTVPGIDREPGWWLFNGSPFTSPWREGRNGGTRPSRSAEDTYTPQGAISPDANPWSQATSAAPNGGSPVFLQGLQRNRTGSGKVSGKGNDKNTGNDILSPTGVSLQWRTLPIDIAENPFGPNFNMDSLRQSLQSQLMEEKSEGAPPYVGVELPLDVQTIAKVGLGSAKKTLAQIRNTVQQVAPGAALLCSLGSRSSGSRSFEEVVSALAPECDGIIIDEVRLALGSSYNPSYALWAVKTARRNAEEQPGYDLPIFVRITGSTRSGFPLDLFLAGATGFVDNLGRSNGAESTVSGVWWPLQKTIERNSSLFVGSVTLEDVGLVSVPSLDDSPASTTAPATVEPPVATFEPAPELKTLDLYRRLRASGRIPLLARFGKKGSRETFVMSLGNRVSQDTINDLRDAAQDGARIYLEGAPFEDETGKYVGWRLTNLVGAEAKTLGVERSGPTTKHTSMTLEDGWMFGTSRGTSIDVVQTVTVKLVAANLVENIKTEKGLYQPRGSRAAAVLADGTPGVVVNSIGKGEVIWTPHRIVSAPASFPPALNDYYEAIASYLQPSLVQVRAVDRKSGGAENIRVALRRSAKGTLLLGLFNDGDKDAKIGAGIDGVAKVALDLTTEKEAPVTTSGFFTEAIVDLPPHSSTLLAFAKDRATLDEERNAPRLKIRLK